MSNERLTEKLVRKLLWKNGYYKNENIKIEEQKSKNKFINNLLRKSSKNRTKKPGFPEFIISSNGNSDLVIIVECKFNVKNHSSNNLKNLEFNNVKKFAMDGSLWYAQFLKKHFNIISIAVSGMEENYKITKYIIKKYEKKTFTKKIIKENEIWEFDKYLEEFSFKNEFNLKITDGEISDFADEVNNILRDYYDMDNSLKPILISMILIGMKDITKEIENKKIFINHSTDKMLFLKLKNEAIKILSNYKEQTEQKVWVFKEQIKLLEKYFKDSNKSIELISKNKYSSNFANIIIKLYHKIYKILKGKKYTFDPIGIFYSKLLKYSTGEGKNLGIVLTPNHITDLFADLANDGIGIKKTDVLIDTCAGSGGFLISGYKKMIAKCKTKEEIKNVKENCIFGYEKDPKMFALAITNMILMGDGKTNFINSDSFTNNSFNGKSNLGFINPPYSKKRENYKEFDFIQRIIDMQNKSVKSEVIAIIPLAIISKKDYEEERNALLRKNTLKAVISMPDDLFYPVSSVNTAIIILEPNKPHEIDKKVWMARLKDDGFVKLKHKGRVDKNNRWKIIKKELIDFYKNKEVDENKFNYIKVKIDMKDNNDWSPEAYVKTNFTNINEEIFQEKVKEQIIYRLKNNLLNENNVMNEIKNKKLNLYDVEWKEFFYKDVFDIENNGKKNSFTIKRIEKSLVESNPGDTPYVSSSSTYHGITAYTSINKKIINSPIITLANSGSVGNAFFQEKDFLGTDSIFVFGLRNFKELDVYTGIFLTSLIELEKFRYSFGRAFRSYRLINKKIWLPIDKNRNINFKFMRNYLKKFDYINLLSIKK